ncbi:MAG: LLM class flavin-dependent oxidoreductase, partial [Acidimicrobiales bacterium]
MGRYGMTVPFDGIPLSEQGSLFAELADLGYTDLWSSEANGTDAFTPLAVASVHAPTMRLGTAIVPAYTRGPGLMAMSVAALAEVAPGRSRSASAPRATSSSSAGTGAHRPGRRRRRRPQRGRGSHLRVPVDRCRHRQGDG